MSIGPWLAGHSARGARALGRRGRPAGNGGVVFPGGAHEAAQRDGVERVDGPFHSAQIGRGGRPLAPKPAPAAGGVTHHARYARGGSNREFLNMYAEAAGGEKVAQFVDEDQTAQYQQEDEEATDIG